VRQQQDSTIERLPRLLGWASLGLGTAQLAAPHAVSRLAGVDDSATARAAVPLAGTRELGHAALLLGSREPAPWVWTRVAGDVIDLTALSRALAFRRGVRRGRTAIATAAVAAITAADLYAAVQERRRKKDDEEVIDLHASITVKRPRAEVYRYWHDFANFPRFMAYVESVETDGRGHSHWTVRGPARWTVEWDADITVDRQNELIAWQSTGRIPVGNTGSVRFSDAPGDRGTELRIDLAYEPPAGRAGAAVAKLLGAHPEQQVRDNLRRFKQVMETGEVVRSDGSPEGSRAFRQAKQRPAQPLATG
jgi:uncharacterized membrane protein